jgi:hypothetical protein
MPTIDRVISKSKLKVFRRLFMKRRISGDYESTWQRVPDDLIINWGSIDYSVDDIKINFLKFSGAKLRVHNDTGYFSDPSESKSFFNGSDSRYRTLVKIEAGYTDTDSSEYPTNTTLYTGIMDAEFKFRENNEIDIGTKHLTKVFEEIPAVKVAGLNTTTGLTATEVFDKIKGFTDGAGTAVFLKYITTTNWLITSTTQKYKLVTSGNLDGMSCWKLMRKLSESENYITYVNRSEQLVFRDKSVNTTTAKYGFHGLGSHNTTYGHNIIKRVSVDEGLKKVWNRIRVKHEPADTATSMRTIEENWTWGDSSSSYLYGIRTYNYTNVWLTGDTAGAEAVAQSLFNEYAFPKQETDLTVKFVPHLMVNDRVNVRYETLIPENSDSLWGKALWNNFLWGKRLSPNIRLNGDFRIISIRHNLDNFTSQVKLREL